MHSTGVFPTAHPPDLIVGAKRRYDAFLGTELDLVLRLHGIENLVVTGVCTDVCVSATVQHGAEAS